MVPLLGLLPVLVAVVLASEGRFGTPGGSPVASAPAATSTTGVAALAPTPVSNQAPAGQTQSQQSPAAAIQAPAQTTPSQSTGSAQNPGAQTTAPVAAGQTSVASGSATTPAAAATANSGAGLFRAYRVQSGDTVRFVAQMFGVSPASVSQASGLQNPDQLRVGQLLTVPIQPGWLYRVQSGETLDQIAARTGVPSALIASASQLTIATVQAGDVILIPDQSAARSK
jgi:LysM repeat protein